MSSRRCLRAASAIREVVSMAILTEIKDPRVRNVTVTGVAVAPDLREARVYISVLGDENRAQLSIRGLQSAAGFLQARIAERIETRYTPKLSFEVDKGALNANSVTRTLQDLELHGEFDEEDDGPRSREEGSTEDDIARELKGPRRRPPRPLSRQSWSSSLLSESDEVGPETLDAVANAEDETSPSPGEPRGQGASNRQTAGPEIPTSQCDKGPSGLMPPTGDAAARPGSD